MSEDKSSIIENDFQINVRSKVSFWASLVYVHQVKYWYEVTDIITALKVYCKQLYDKNEAILAYL